MRGEFGGGEGVVCVGRLTEERSGAVDDMKNGAKKKEKIFVKKTLLGC